MHLPVDNAIHDFELIRGVCRDSAHHHLGLSILPLHCQLSFRLFLLSLFSSLCYKIEKSVNLSSLVITLCFYCVISCCLMRPPLTLRALFSQAHTCGRDELPRLSEG